MKILVFLHGTLLMHRTGEGRAREDRVRQVEEADPAVSNFESYIPIGHAAKKLNAWAAQGASIAYLSSHQDPKGVAADRKVLLKYDFPEGDILFRDGQENYASLAQRCAPDILIEDDCESIGGTPEMVYMNMEEPLKRRTKSIVIREFSGIDDLPEVILDLLKFQNRV